MPSELHGFWPVTGRNEKKYSLHLKELKSLSYVKHVSRYSRVDLPRDGSDYFTTNQRLELQMTSLGPLTTEDLS